MAWGIFGLLALRILPLTMFAPWVTWMNAPWAIRIAVSLALTIAFFPFAYAPTPVLPQTLWEWAACGIHELAIGTMFAVATSVPLYALQWAGGLIEQWRGTTGVESDINPQPLEQWLLMFGIAVFVALGGHRLAITIFTNMLQHTPPMHTLHANWALFALGSARLVADGLALCVVLSAPFIGALLITEVTWMAITRVHSSFPVSTLSSPLRAALVLVVLWALLGVLVMDLPDIFRESLQSAKTLLREFAK